MTIDKKVKIELNDGSFLEADRFVSYGNDSEYIAKVGNDMYIKIDGKHYSLCSRDFYKKE